MTQIDTPPGSENLMPMNEQTNRVLSKCLKYLYLYAIIRFKLNYRQVSIITHTDFDGAVSAAIVLQKFPYARVYFATARILYKVLYIVRRKSSSCIPHTIYILDLSVDEQFLKRTIKAIKDIREGALVEIFWIDHHKSAHLGEMQNYVELFIDPHIPHAAMLVRSLVNDDPKADILLELLQNVNTPFSSFWKPILKVVLRDIQRVDLRVHVLKSMAAFRKTKYAFYLYQRYQNEQKARSKIQTEIFTTFQGYKFGFLHYDGNEELYPWVNRTLFEQALDFLLVQFDDGALSAYKRKESPIDLTTLLYLVGGRGHAYAFHFEPQMRITDEFFRPLCLSDLLKKVQELL